MSELLARHELEWESYKGAIEHAAAIGKLDEFLAEKAATDPAEFADRLIEQYQAGVFATPTAPTAGKVNTSGFAGELAGITAEAESQRAKLYRQDGGPIFAADTTAERLEAIATAERERLAELLERTEPAMDTLNAERQRLQGASQLDALRTDELSRANSLAGFLEKELAGMNWPQLATRFEAAAQSGDKALLYLLSRFTDDRLQNPPQPEIPHAKRIAAAKTAMIAKLTPPQSAARLKEIEAQKGELSRLQWEIRKRTTPAQAVEPVRL